MFLAKEFLFFFQGKYSNSINSLQDTARDYYTKKRLSYINETVNDFIPKILELENSRVNVDPLNREFEELQEDVDRLLRKVGNFHFI